MFLRTSSSFIAVRRCIRGRVTCRHLTDDAQKTLDALMQGSTSGGDPSSLTGLLTGVGPMLRHAPAEGAVHRFTIQNETVAQTFHPERPERLSAVYEELVRSGLATRTRWISTETASHADLALAHDASLASAATSEYESDALASTALGIDPDTYFAAESSGHACALAAGSVTAMASKVALGELRNGLAVVRPPGHHAERHRSMGFCLLNNVAVAASVLRHRLELERVLIVDWDVHHGNGVQQIFEDDPNVMYASMHRYGNEFYPGTGAPTEVGVGSGVGRTLNIGWSHGHGPGDADCAEAFETLLLPVAHEFRPDIVLVCAGFDAAEGDPLGGARVTTAGFAHMTHQLSSLADGKLVLAMEGGYDLEANAASAAACLRVLLDEESPVLAETSPTEEALRDIEATRASHEPYWQCLR